MKEFNIRDPENEMINKVYKNDNNYQVVDTGNESRLCYIFFSSNGLYYPDTSEVFEKQILNKDRYEWKWVVKESRVPEVAERIIYVRDIWKQWYSKGINNRANTIDKTIELLRQLTDTYRIITVGSSAGGYMAVLTAAKLNAEYCINFSGQYSISKEFGNPYTRLTELLHTYNGEVFYFVPGHCEADQEEYQSVADLKCIRAFVFSEFKHASTMLVGNMSYIIDKNKDALLDLYRRNENKEIDKFVFLIQTVSFSQTIIIMIHEIKEFLIRKVKKYRNGI